MKQDEDLLYDPPPLDSDAFEKYLTDQEDGAVVGELFSMRSCPIANYLNETNWEIGDDCLRVYCGSVKVYIDEPGSFLSERATFDLPDVFKTFIALIDREDQIEISMTEGKVDIGSGTITKEDALKFWQQAKDLTINRRSS